RSRAEELVKTSQEFLDASWVNAAAGGEAPIDLGAAAYQSLEEVRERAGELAIEWWSTTPFPSDQAVALGAHAAEPYRGDTGKVMDDVRRWIHDEWHVVLVTEGHGPAERLAEVVREEGLGAKRVDLPDPPEPSIVYVATGRLEHGFIWDAVKLAV